MTDEASKLADLKPCPFCGGEAELCDDLHWQGNPQRQGFCGWCPKCDLSLEYLNDRQAAIAAWNTRTHDATLTAQNKALKEALALADELLMEAWGAYPLPGDPNREKMSVIRNITGPDYQTRKILARKALEAANG